MTYRYTRHTAGHAGRLMMHAAGVLALACAGCTSAANPPESSHSEKTRQAIIKGTQQLGGCLNIDIKLTEPADVLRVVMKNATISAQPKAFENPVMGAKPSAYTYCPRVSEEKKLPAGEYTLIVVATQGKTLSGRDTKPIGWK